MLYICGFTCAVKVAAADAERLARLQPQMLKDMLKDWM